MTGYNCVCVGGGRGDMREEGWGGKRERVSGDYEKWFCSGCGEWMVPLMWWVVVLLWVVALW